VLFRSFRRNRKNKPPLNQEDSVRYGRRWTVERTFAWLGNFRRLIVRYERSIATYRAFFHLACALIALRLF
jgi:transposase